MPSHEQDSASDSSVSGDWEQQGGGRNTSQHHADGEQQDDGQGGKKGGKSELHAFSDARCDLTAYRSA